ncbi:MAG: hypothetical protein JW768_08185 [Chitinispirillaceae bacterium]|nr:hypothetical protein [Chitinispirillaceae bacterium]
MVIRILVVLTACCFLLSDFCHPPSPKQRAAESATVPASVAASAPMSTISAPKGGYESLLRGSRDHLIDSVFPSLRVFINKQDTIGNEFVHELPDEEIRSAVKLGLYLWASILPDLNVEFVKNHADANFTVTFKDLTSAGWAGYTNFWTSGPTAGMTINCVNLAFRSLDFASPFMSFEYYQAAWDRNEPRWVEYWSGGATGEGKTYDQQLKRLAENYGSMDLALERICFRWGCLLENERALTALPHYSVFGGKRFKLGVFDLAGVVQHEFGHVLGIDESDGNSETLGGTCGTFSCMPRERFNDRRPAHDRQKEIWIPRAPIRKHPSFGISEKTSYCAHMGNSWGGRGWNSRAIFNRDADIVSAELVSRSDCATVTKTRGKPFVVSYPKIRTGWSIVLQNKTSKDRFYTDNWHVAHEKMGWVLNENTAALDCEWFVVDILDEKKSAKR